MKGSMLAVILTVAGLAGGQVGAVDWSGYGIKDIEQGAIAGDPDAQFLLGRHYDRRYSNEATRWYQLAAEQGYRTLSMKWPVAIMWAVEFHKMIASRWLGSTRPPISATPRPNTQWPCAISTAPAFLRTTSMQGTGA